MSDWLQSLRDRLAQGEPVARVTVAAVKGSAPREAGASILIGSDWEEGTIGGGHLELMAINLARDLLARDIASPRLDRFPLGASLGQCCGGIVELWFERWSGVDLAFVEETLRARATAAPLVLATTLHGPGRTLLSAADAETKKLLDTGADARLSREGGGTLYERLDQRLRPLWLFGAGHVGKALVRVLADLPFDITWVDSREDMFPAGLPANVRALIEPAPADAVPDAPSGALFLVLTHSHDLDYEICRAILEWGDFAWAGLIGSATKAARFTQRMRARGFSERQIARITCPIGIDGIDSKLPAAIAVSVAAQVLQAAEALAAAEQPRAERQG